MPKPARQIQPALAGNPDLGTNRPFLWKTRDTYPSKQTSPALRAGENGDLDF